MKNIKELLEKFYQGQTSDDEEIQLKQFFSSNSIPKEFEQDKIYFDYLSKASQIEYLDNSFDDIILQKIEKYKVKPIKKLQRIINIAAVFLTIIGLYLISQNNNFITTKKTYTTEEIQAMVLTINTLSKVSKYMNQTNKSLEKLDKINKAFEKLNEINKINEYNKFVINKLGEKL